MFDKHEYQKEYHKTYVVRNKERLAQYRREYYQRNKDEITRKKLERIAQDPKKHLRQKHESYIRNREHHLEVGKKYRTRIDRRERDAARKKIERQKYPGRYRARYILGNAVKRGEIIRGNCYVCGTDKYIQAHHDDYSQPLKVKWCCIRHHMELHRKHK